MSRITPETQALIGVPGERQTAPHPLGLDTLRRFVQAVMEPNPMHWDEAEARRRGFDGLVATPLQPVHLFARASGTEDTFARFKTDPDWDGMWGTASKGLPKLDLPFKRILNGGNSCEFYQLAKVGDTVSRRSTYVDIAEREGSSGPMIVIRTETLYTNQHGDKLMRIVHTEIAR